MTELRSRASGAKGIGFLHGAGSSLQRFAKQVPVEAVGGGLPGFAYRRDPV